jgi:predicted membrane metal-binding protein
VLRAGASVDLLDVRNLGPAVQVVMLLGLKPSAVGPIEVVILIVALVATIVAALRVRDPLESLLWAAIASFVVLPVTWFHHFAALIPFGVAALVRANPADPRTMQRLLALAIASFAIGAIGFGQPPTWLLAPVFLAGARLSRPAPDAPGS